MTWGTNSLTANWAVTIAMYTIWRATERRLILWLEILEYEEVSSKSAPLLPEQDFSEDEPTMTYCEMDAEVSTPLPVLPKAVPVRLHGCRPSHMFLLFRPL